MSLLTDVTISSLPSINAVAFKGIGTAAMVTAWQWNTLVAFGSFPIGSFGKKITVYKLPLLQQLTTSNWTSKIICYAKERGEQKTFYYLWKMLNEKKNTKLTNQLRRHKSLGLYIHRERNLRHRRHRKWALDKGWVNGEVRKILVLSSRPDRWLFPRCHKYIGWFSIEKRLFFIRRS